MPTHTRLRSQLQVVVDHLKQLRDDGVTHISIEEATLQELRKRLTPPPPPPDSLFLLWQAMGSPGTFQPLPAVSGEQLAIVVGSPQDVDALQAYLHHFPIPVVCVPALPWNVPHNQLSGYYPMVQPRLATLHPKAWLWTLPIHAFPPSEETTHLGKPAMYTPWIYPAHTTKMAEFYKNSWADIVQLLMTMKVPLTHSQRHVFG